MTGSTRPESLINKEHCAEDSLVLRYLNSCGMDMDAEDRARFHQCLVQASAQEGVRLIPLLRHCDVEIDLLDETSRMLTGTFKSIDGCVSAAHAKLRGYDRVVLESGGNLATALTVYGRRLDIETFCLVPQANLPLLTAASFASPISHLIAVQDRGLVKQVTHRLAKTLDLPLIPRLEWRFHAAMFRGMFILEQLLDGRHYDWLSQTISAAFGPIGIYRVLMRYQSEINAMPKFLGIQQAANCPMYQAWIADRGDRAAATMPEEPLLVPVMYDVRPQTHGTYAELASILDDTAGALTTVNATEMDAFLERRFDGRTAVELLADQNIPMTERNGELVEKAGLMALAGLIKEIDDGTIPAGSRVLCSLTGGVAIGDGSARPDHRIERLDQVDHLYRPEVIR